MPSASVMLLVWTPEAEAERTGSVAGMKVTVMDMVGAVVLLLHMAIRVGIHKAGNMAVSRVERKVVNKADP
jgi:hypothetical protein